MTSSTITQFSASERVFSMAQIGIATFFSGPLGGFVMAAINYRALGHVDKVVPALLTGVALTVALVTIANAYPPGGNPWPVAILGMVITGMLVRMWQEKMITAMLEQADVRQSVVAAIAVTVVCAGTSLLVSAVVSILL